ncbi:MAG: F0F1 ATP synthase subunit epsilon [Chloroflexi bacterium]|nr:F0F1 ATP synthase subunit epsilon [Chloroflexota bacterium]
MSESDAGDAGFVRLHIVSPEEVLFDGRVSWAQVPLEDGMIGIWPGHGALVAALGSGEVEYLVGGDVLRLGIGSGVLRISDERCVVMVSRLLGEDDEGDAAGGAVHDTLFDELEEVLEEPWPDDEADREAEG